MAVTKTSDMTPTTGNINDIICLGFVPEDHSCPAENTLVSFISLNKKQLG